MDLGKAWNVGLDRAGLIFSIVVFIAVLVFYVLPALQNASVTANLSHP